MGRGKKSNKEGMAFQRKVQQLNDDTKRRQMSRQTINSGAIWFDPGDVATEADLIECKERKLNAKGEKSFTITKEILEKIGEEAGYHKNAVVAFGFKGDDKVYCIADYNLWLAMAQRIDTLEKEIEYLSETEDI